MGHLKRLAKQVRAVHARLEPRKNRIAYDDLTASRPDLCALLRALDDVGRTVKDVDEAHLQDVVEL